ncbi:unnamed protein product [Polarella glacialis]|uniref:Uncharacterized protein n=1 Tax=Polarella glacialis TaxID=89957 RepID=A0A813GUI0_POLGL|nr:unnamed protein product [Polarella glacialis]
MCFFAALAAFAVKMLAISLKTVNSSYALWYRMGCVLALMNQCMGCVILEVVLQDRLFLFVFGGPNAEYEDEELAYKNVYECRLVKQIWTQYWEKRDWFRAMVLLATFDHYDLQTLLIKKDPKTHGAERLGLSPIQEGLVKRTHSAPDGRRRRTTSAPSSPRGTRDAISEKLGRAWSPAYEEIIVANGNLPEEDFQVMDAQEHLCGNCTCDSMNVRREIAVSGIKRNFQSSAFL